MGLLSLKRLMSMQREQKLPRRLRRRRQVEVNNRRVASLAKRRGSPCQQEDNYQGVKRMKNPWTFLPEDIWYHIHSLLPMQDAARTACVSHTFLRSWRCHPNLTFSKETLGLNDSLEKDKAARELTIMGDHIMKKHSGIGLRTFRLEFLNTSYLDDWLEIAITPALEELILMLVQEDKLKYYSFPFSLLFNKGGNSIKDLHLSHCAFHPTIGLDCLTRLYLSEVCISGDELGCFLSNSFALEELTLTYCQELDYLRIPCLLQQLSYVHVFDCKALQMMEIKAPNISAFHYVGNIACLSGGDLLAVKNLHISSFQYNVIYDACAKLPSIVPAIETLTISSDREKVNTPIAPFRFLHLKCLAVTIHKFWGGFSKGYDYLSLAYFLDMCPVLETFILTMLGTCMRHDVISEDSSHMRQMPGLRHDNIKTVEIIGFCSAKSIVELTCHILDNAKSLERLTLDTICDVYQNPNRNSVHEIGLCSPLCGKMIMEAENALLAIKRYIFGKVPSTVKLDVLRPCNWCHSAKTVA